MDELCNLVGMDLLEWTEAGKYVTRGVVISDILYNIIVRLSSAITELTLLHHKNKI